MVVFLAGAAFAAARWMSPAPTAPGSTQIIGQNGWKVEINPGMIQRSTEVPRREPDELGQFAERQDSSLFLKKASGIPGEDLSSAPTIEVLVTHDTLIYRDITLEKYSSPPKAGEKIPQVLEMATLDEIDMHNLVSVWGEKRGERWIAAVIVFSAPIIKEN